MYHIYVIKKKLNKSRLWLYTYTCIHCGARVFHLIASKAVNESTINRNYLNTVQDLGSLYNQTGKFKQLFKNN